MSAAALFDQSVPHGTPDGYQKGCRGSHCPAPVPCRDVYFRYAGDYGFRKALDAGMTAVEVVEAEREHAERLAEAARQGRGARPVVRTAAVSVGDRRPAANRARAGAAALIPRDTLRALLGEGLTDRQIADRLGLERRQVTRTRNTAGFERNPDRNRRPVTTSAPATAGASSS